jgi:hypothetical protein
MYELVAAFVANDAERNAIEGWRESGIRDFLVKTHTGNVDATLAAHGNHRSPRTSTARIGSTTASGAW